jgi:hypothetical protein
MTRPADERKVTGAELPEALDDVWDIPASSPGLEALVLLAREDAPLSGEEEAGLKESLRATPLPIPPGMNGPIWLEDGQEVTFRTGDRSARGGVAADDNTLIRGIPSPTPRKSDDPILRLRALLGERVKPLGGFSQAVLFPNMGG